MLCNSVAPDAAIANQQHSVKVSTQTQNGAAGYKKQHANNGAAATAHDGNSMQHNSRYDPAPPDTATTALPPPRYADSGRSHFAKDWKLTSQIHYAGSTSTYNSSGPAIRQNSDANTEHQPGGQQATQPLSAHTGLPTGNSSTAAGSCDSRSSLTPGTHCSNVGHGTIQTHEYNPLPTGDGSSAARGTDISFNGEATAEDNAHGWVPSSHLRAASGAASPVQGCITGQSLGGFSAAESLL